jgi:hypothetical protein
MTRRPTRSHEQRDLAHHAQRSARPFDAATIRRLIEQAEALVADRG